MLNNIFSQFRQSSPTIPRPVQRFLFRLIGLIGLGGIAYGLTAVQPKVVSPEGAALGVAEVSNVKPVEIVFDNPVDKGALRYEIHPDLPGVWDVRTSVFPARSVLSFTPSQSPALDTRYTIALSGIKSLFGSHTENYLLSFQTDTAPTLQSVSPAEGSVDIMPDAPIILTFDKTVTDSVELSALLEPALLLDAPRIEGNTVTFSHQEPLLKNTAYTLSVTLRTSTLDYASNTRAVSEEGHEIASVKFTSIAAPGILSYSPTGTSIDPAAAVTIEFQQDMDAVSTEAAFSVSPEVAGIFAWEHPRKMTFTPEAPLLKDQEYTVTLAKTATASNGLSLEEDLSFHFTTLGAVIVTKWSPASGATGVDTAASISVTFDQQVDSASAEAAFTISPSVSGAFAWSGNTLTFNPSSALSHNQSYTVTIRKGVQSVKGLDSVADATASFKTKTESVMLNVPAYRQTHMYSCMVSATRSALAYRGVRVSEADIIARVGIDPTPWSGTWAEGGAVWGDPDAAIIGDLDGNADSIGWGYGSHWDPMSRALTSYGILNDVRRNMTVQDLAQAVADGNPVIIWWVNGVWPAYVVNWKTPDGKEVRGVNSMHVQVVRGFTGTVDNPLSFTVTDSGYKYPGRTFDIGTFKAKWSWFGNTGIIVK